VAAWRRQRQVYGYSLFAEMPWYALELVDDHPEADIRGLQIFVVDEFQDLNACEIALVEALIDRGVIVIAVGDDDVVVRMCCGPTYGCVLAPPA